MTKSQKNRPHPVRLFARTVWHWDLWVAIAAALGFCLVYTVRPFQLQASGGIITACIAGGLTCFGVVSQLRKSVLDRHRDSALGEITRAVDHDNAALTLPHTITGAASLMLVGVSVWLLVLGPVAPAYLAIFYGSMIFFGLYSLLGIYSLWRMDRVDEARDARLRTAAEDDQRRRRSGRQDEER